jgi:hypothetical protein
MKNKKKAVTTPPFSRNLIQQQHTMNDELLRQRYLIVR